jgi:hypothetical protein
MALTQVQSGILADSTQTYGMKNRIINGDMRIDQRNAGASVTQNDTGIYTLDRWSAYGVVTSKFAVRQNVNSVTPPAGFKNYLGITSSSAYSITSGDIYIVQQNIEGYNVADLAWGTASASTVTLSFWVRSSLTGTFGGSLTAGNSRNYPWSYTISSANTWEYKTITIPGDTSGTWGSTNGTGVIVNWSLGTGSTYSNTAGAWTASSSYSVPGATSLVGTSGATLYITGVQFEKGSTATQFDYRPFGTELQLCQRYFCKTFPFATAPAQNADSPGSIAFISYGSNLYDAMWRFPVEMRASPGTMTTYSPNAANANWSNNGGTPTASIVHSASTGITIRAQSPAGAGYSHIIHASASAEL